MRILAIETSGAAGEVALAEGDRVVGVRPLDPGRRHTQLLVPAMAALLAEAGWTAVDLGLVAVSIGPGSYTGSRVGVTCAKTLAYAAKLEVIGVETLEVIAWNAPAGARRVAVVSDAQRADVYRAEFVRRQENGPPEVLRATAVVSAAQWAAELEPGTLVLGPGLHRYRELVPAACTVLPEETWEPRAAVVAQIAWRDYRAGRRDDLWSLQPRYLRKSAAEEKWEAREARPKA